MSYFNRISSLAVALVLVVLASPFVLAQSPPVPEKSPVPMAAPSKTTPQPLASPQAQASPQQSFAPQYDQPAVVLRAVPQVYAVNRLVLAAPVASYATVAYDSGCVAQQQVVVQRQIVQRNVVSHGVHQQVVVNHAAVAAGGRQPKKIVTKQVTKVRRGLFGRG